MRDAGEAAEALTRVPAHTQDALRMYIDEHIQPGGFLTAVLHNDLTQACMRADIHNRFALFDIVSYIYNFAPMNCWGSKERVAAWLTQRR